MSEDKTMLVFEDLYFMLAGGLFATVIQSYSGATYTTWETAAGIIGGFTMIALAEYNRRAAQ